MTRIVALVLLVALLVATGFWLVRDRDGASGTARSGADTGSAVTDVGDAGGAADVADVAGEPADATEAATNGASPAAENAPASETANGASDPPAGSGSAAAPESTDDDASGDQAADAQAGRSEEGDDVAQDADAPGPAADASTTDEDAGLDEDSADEEGADDEAFLLPDGYTAVPFQSGEPQQVFDVAKQVLQPGLDYIALLRTNRGDMVIDLYEDRTPVTVNNFVFLALQRYYEGVPFHRVLEDFMAQTGDPTGSGRGGPGYAFEDEIVPSLSFDRAGLVAMANSGPGTNGSQFFVTFAATPWLDGNHTIFGQVTEGEEILDAITRVDPQTPSAVAAFDDTIAALAEQGVVLPGDPSRTVADTLEEMLGTVPLAGQSFTVAGYRGAVGQLGGEPAFGFFPHPDVLESVVIATAPRP
ncbi:MAG: peptidylprolyl isomerase [Trueperaceae bacterium]